MAPSRVSEPDRCDLASAQARKRSTPAASFGLQGQTTVLRSLWSGIRTRYSRGISSVLYPMSYPLQASLVPVARRDSNPERSCERRKPCACRQSMTPSSESFAEHGWTNCMTAPPAPLARRHQLCFLSILPPLLSSRGAQRRGIPSPHAPLSVLARPSPPGALPFCSHPRPRRFRPNKKGLRGHPRRPL